MTLSERAFQVAVTGEIQEDDPHIIADLMAEIDRLQAENLALRRELDHPIPGSSGVAPPLA